eukprot:TRINITY_DN646_c1_g1_i1.p1 TRINITY_DN646_c1_g1~~TRINITY_DN646_c1_g1_i1.p1  ORF type:complete len:937 (-),score=236.69 TRINITY_DN646_c1_g1_i1:88-2898(-)
MEQIATLKLQDSVSCVCVCGDQVFIGTQDGKIVNFKILTGTSPEGKVVWRLSMEGKRSINDHGKPIDQMDFDDRLNVLFFSCDGVFYIYDMFSVSQLYVHKDGHKLSCFALDSKPYNMREKKTYERRMALSIRKEVRIFDVESGTGMTEVKRLSLPDTILSLGLFGNMLCLGFRREYCLMDIEKGDITELAQIDTKTQPKISVATAVEEGEFLLVMDNVGVYLYASGPKMRHSSRGTVRWSEMPKRVVHCFPFLIGLVGNGVEIHNMFDRDLPLMQSIPFRCGMDMGVGDAASSILVKRDDSRLPGRGSQTKRVILASNDLLSLLMPLPPERHILSLVREVRVNDALQMFEKTYENAPEDERKRLLERINEEAGFAYFFVCRFADAFQSFEQCLQLDPREILVFFPDLVLLRPVYVPKHRVLLEKHVSVEAIIRSNAERGKSSDRLSTSPPMASSSSSSSPSTASPRTSFASVQSGGSASSSSRTNIAVSHAMAKTELSKYLYAIRLRARGISEEALAAVDFALLNIHLQHNNVDQMHGLLSSKNHCPVEESKEILLRHKRGHALALLLQTHKRYEEALQIWSDMGERGIDPIVDCLSRLEDEDLILLYARKVMHTNPEKGIRIFLSRSRSKALDPKRVLQFLKLFHEEATLQYLEFIIRVEKSQNPEYHTQLCQMYITRVQMMRPQEHPALSIHLRAGEEEGPLGSHRSNLLQLLMDSDKYDVFAIMNQLESTTLYDERIQVYTKAKQHEKALQILLYHKKQFSMAERYCQTHEENRGELFLLLFSLCLHPKPLEDGIVEPVRMEDARYLLENYWDEMDPVHVLKLLPPELMLKELMWYLKATVTMTEHSRRESSIVKSLRNVDRLNVQLERAAAQSRHIEISAHRACAKCGKQISQRHAIVVYPDLSVYHLGCHVDPFIDPISGRDFRKSPEEL